MFRMVPMLLYYPHDTDTEPQRVLSLNDNSTIEYLGQLGARLVPLCFLLTVWPRRCQVAVARATEGLMFAS